MPTFNSSDLNRFFNQGENEISGEKPFLFDRLEIATQSGTSTYTLPDYVTSIRRVTFLGWKLDPLPERNFREVFQSNPSFGQPFWYIYNNIGANKIQLFPTPNQTLVPGVDPWATDIPTQCIVEFARATDNNNFIIPLPLRRQLLKNYVAYRCYQVDGAGRNNKLTKYYKEKWAFWKQQFVELLDDLYNSPRKYIVSEIVSNNTFPGEPVLPIGQFGISVDEGD